MSERGQHPGYSRTVGGNAPGTNKEELLNGVDFYTYPALFGRLNAGLTAQVQLQIQQSMDFEWVNTTFNAHQNGSAYNVNSLLVPWPLTVQITDSIGNVMFNTPTHIQAIAGIGQNPFWLPISKIFPANSTVTVAITNISTGGAAIDIDDIVLSLNGRRLFQYSSQG